VSNPRGATMDEAARLDYRRSVTWVAENLTLDIRNQ
jgi:hypothetical protein